MLQEVWFSYVAATYFKLSFELAFFYLKIHWQQIQEVQLTFQCSSNKDLTNPEWVNTPFHPPKQHIPRVKEIARSENHVKRDELTKIYISYGSEENPLGSAPPIPSLSWKCLFVLNVKKVMKDKLASEREVLRGKTNHNQFPYYMQYASHNHTALTQQKQTSGLLPIFVHSNSETAKVNCKYIYQTFFQYHNWTFLRFSITQHLFNLGQVTFSVTFFRQTNTFHIC